MVRHHGSHVGSKSRSFSECLPINDILCIHSLSRLAIKYQLRANGSKLTSEDAQIIENKRIRLQRLIDMFEHQADSFLLHQGRMDDAPISSLRNYDEYDNVDSLDHASDRDTESASLPSHHPILRTSDGSGMETLHQENLPILLPSSLGWEWCVSNGVQSLAVKEAQLRHAQANDSIHRIRLALGFKSALFRTQVRPANTQQTKTRAWNAVHSVDTTVHEHARIYSMARDAYPRIRNGCAAGPDFPRLQKDDLHIATLVLGSEQTGQRNKQQSWIWGFGRTVEDDETWMNDCKLPYSLGGILLCSSIEQLKGFIGSVQRHSLKDGWMNKTASIMKLNGFLHTFIPMQRHGRSSWYMLHRCH
jgi:hypothetical protein